MEIAPAGIQLTFEVTFSDSDLPVAMSVYDVTGDSPDLVQGPTAMTNISGTNTYTGTFTPSLGESYVIVKGVYTDDTYTALDPDYAQGSESIIALNQGDGGSISTSCAVIGIVEPNPTIIGIVQC